MPLSVLTVRLFSATDGHNKQTTDACMENIGEPLWLQDRVQCRNFGVSTSSQAKSENRQ